MTNTIWMEDNRDIVNRLYKSFYNYELERLGIRPFLDANFYYRMDMWVRAFEHVVDADCTRQGGYIEFDSDEAMIMFKLEWA